MRIRELSSLHADLAKLPISVVTQREFMTPPNPPKLPIGFITPEDNGSK